MKNKIFWIGFVVVYITLQAIGFVIHGILMNDTYEALAAVFRPKEQMDSMMGIMFVSAAVVTFVFCYVFTHGREGTGVMEGVRYGTIMGVFLALPTSIDAYVIYPITQELAAVWFISTVVSLMIGGVVFSVIYKPSG